MRMKVKSASDAGRDSNYVTRNHITGHRSARSIQSKYIEGDEQVAPIHTPHKTIDLYLHILYTKRCS